MLNRRDLLKATLPAALGLTGLARAWSAEGDEKLPPVRTITRGPKFHWFGYYDKLEFDPTDRYVLGMEVDFEHRSPRPEDTIRIGMVDLADGDRWIEFGTSSAWCWQQGCMLQWRPGSASEILWNDREGDHYICRLLDVKSGLRRTVPYPVYSVSPDGRWAVAPDFRRLAVVRPGYGYNGLPDRFDAEGAPRDSGIFRIDLETGEQKLIVSLADIAKMPSVQDSPGTKHWFNHLLVNPDGSRFEFLHRWRRPGQGGWTTHMCTAAPDGSDVRVIDPSGFTSHFIWRDPSHILAWSRQEPHGGGFFVFEDKSGGLIEQVGRGVMTQDGHCTYLPGNRWVLCDTYPDRARRQHPYLFHIPSGRRVSLGRFLLPPTYSGEWRCDTHPRLSRDGKKVVIDTPAEEGGRQLHLIDIAGIVGAM
jgi:hypothetical protein